MRQETSNTYSWNCIQTGLFGLLSFGFWLQLYPAHLHVQEQFQLFQYTTHYLLETSSLPGGMVHYCARFLTQFYHFKLGGPLLISLLLMAFQQSISLLIKLPKSSTNYRVYYTLTFLPSLSMWAFLLHTDGMLSWLMATMLSSYCAVIAIRISSIYKRWIYEVVTAILLFWAVGAGYSLFLGIVVGWETIYLITKQRASDLFFLFFFAFLLWITLPAIAIQHYNYPYEELLWGVGYSRYPLIELPDKSISFVVTLLTSLICLTSNSIRYPKIKAIPYYTIILLLFSGGTLYIGYRANFEEESIFAYDQLTRMEKWGKIIKRAEQKAPKTSWEECCLNLALAQKGVLCERMFAFPHSGREGLLPLYVQDYVTPLFAGEAYFYLGLINTSQRFAFEAMEAIPDYQKSSRCYQRLATTNLINGNYTMAKKYLHHLSNTLFYADWAKEKRLFLNNDSLVNADSTMGKLRLMRLRENLYMNEYAIESIVDKLVTEQPSNELGWQYLFALCLSAKRVGALAHYAQHYQRCFPYQNLPTLVQEALLLSWFQNHQEIESFPFKIEEQTKKRLYSFMQTVQLSSKTRESLLKKYYGETFWYYALTTQ